MAALLTLAYFGPRDEQGILPGEVRLIAIVLPVTQMRFDICLRLSIQPHVSQLCQSLGKDEDKGVPGIKGFSIPHFPITSPPRTPMRNTTCLPPPVVLSEGCYLSQRSLSDSNEDQESEKQEPISNPAGKHQNRNAETVLGDIPGPKTHPSQPLPYRPRLPTPPKPPASVVTPAKNRALGAEAPQATQHLASQLPGQNSKSTRDRDEQIQPSSSECKRQQKLAPVNLANASATRHGRYEQHVQAQPDIKSPCAQAPGIASKESKPTKQRPPSNTKPAGTGRPAGEAGKRKRDDERPPSRATAPAPNKNTNDGQQEPVDHSDDEGESGDEREAPNGNSHRGSRGNKPAEGLCFRCPMHAANPGGDDRRRCREWHNSSIAAVTRHALTDAGTDSDKGRQIRALSRAKYPPKDRWKRYYIIFNNGREDDEMDRPYWGGTNPDETIDRFLRSATASFARGGSSTAESLGLVVEYRELLARRERRDSLTTARADAARARATEIEQAELLQSQREFEGDFARLRARMDHISQVPGGHQADITPTPTVPADNQDIQDLQFSTWPALPMQRTTSGLSGMNATLGTPFGGPDTSPQALTVPGQAPFNPAIVGQNAFATGSQRLTEFIEDVDTVVDHTTDPRTRRRVQLRQNTHYQQSQTLRPPQRDYRYSASAPGSSRRIATVPTSSSNSTGYTPLSDSGTTNSLQPAGYTAAVSGLDNNGDPFMGFHGMDASAYQHEAENQFYRNWPRNQ